MVPYMNILENESVQGIALGTHLWEMKVKIVFLFLILYPDQRVHQENFVLIIFTITWNMQIEEKVLD